jgi:nicotinate-nucleotide adenylyltransferase
MQRIGLLGGTFDPPHIAHLVLADCAIESLGLDDVFFIPAADPPHKQGDTRQPAEHRLRMLERALSIDPRFKLSLVDIERPGPHYTVDTVRIFGQQYPHAELYFVIGSDSLRDLPTWYHPAELVTLCKLAVMRRPDAEVPPDLDAAIMPGLAGRVVFIDAPRLDISSTEIVERLRQGKTVRYLVPDAVLDYIDSGKIYQG